MDVLFLIMIGVGGIGIWVVLSFKGELFCKGMVEEVFWCYFLLVIDFDEVIIWSVVVGVFGYFLGLVEMFCILL